MASVWPRTLQKYLRVVPANHADYEHLCRFHYQGAALEAVGIDKHLWHDGDAIQIKIEPLNCPRRTFIDREMSRFFQKFTNRRGMPDSPQRTGFVLSKLATEGAYYLWTQSSATG